MSTKKTTTGAAAAAAKQAIKEVSGKTAPRAQELMLKSKTVGERTDVFFERIKQSLNIKIILPLQEQVEELDDKIFELEDFSLSTDLNKGLRRLSKEDVEARFTKIMELEAEKTLLLLKLEAKQASFTKYFG